MVTCPYCWGKCNSSKIQLTEISLDDGDYFHCDRCDGCFMFNMIDNECEPEIVEGIREFLQGWHKVPTCKSCGQSEDVHPWACGKFVKEVLGE